VDIADLLLGEGGGGAAGAGIEDGDLPVQLGDEAEGVFLGAAALEDGAPGGEEAELAVAGGLGVGGDDFDAGADQVGPVVDALGIALADDEDEGGKVGQGAVRQPLFPAIGDYDRCL
jgi:hypothetical protein